MGWDKRTLHDYRTASVYPTSIIFAWHRVCYVVWQVYYSSLYLVNFFWCGCGGELCMFGWGDGCSIALYCSFFFTIAVTMRSNWGGSNNPFPFHLLSIIVVIIIISLQVDDYYNMAGKKGYRAFSLSPLSRVVVTITTIYRDIAEQREPTRAQTTNAETEAHHEKQCQLVKLKRTHSGPFSFKLLHSLTSFEIQLCIYSLRSLTPPPQPL